MSYPYLKIENRYCACVHKGMFRSDTGGCQRDTRIVKDILKIKLRQARGLEKSALADLKGPEVSPHLVLSPGGLAVAGPNPPPPQ